MRWFSSRLISYSSGLLIILLIIPAETASLSLLQVSIVNAAIVILVLLCIWGGRNPSPSVATRDALVLRVNQQKKPSRNSVLQEGHLGLYQSWYLEMRLAEEMARCRRYGLSMALIVVRLERTSVVQLSMDGWQDDACEAAYTTAQSVRSVDLTAALGPHEFAVCLVHCDREGAETAQARIEKALAAYGPRSGLVVYPSEKVDLKQMIRLARSRATIRSQRRIAS
ncbi:MAG: GGDEF domain-containing protein [Dehalococcoidia bacterium]